MSGHKSPKDLVLELLVFGPAGLAITAVEEFPKLVEKGRHRVEGQVHAARLVGQFAVQMGRRQVAQTVERFGSQPDDRPSMPSEAEPNESSTPGATADRPATIDRLTDVSSAVVPTTVGTSAAGGGGAPGTNGAVSESALAIPGYDSLSASQVVQRLDGLSPAELEEVGAHEVSHRHRRTILNRVEQLLSGADSERR